MDYNNKNLNGYKAISLYSEIALYPFRNSSSREQSQATKTLGCGETLREMMHVLSHTDICS